MSKEDDTQEIPDIINDSKTGETFKTAMFYGKGSFGKCYEIINDTCGQSFAGKIVSKKLLMEESQGERMTQEIKIHQSIKHPQIVRFDRFFEDDKNIYIVLELCRNKSMKELHKHRKVITEPETRLYMKQLLSGVQYLHEHNIIHGDLKLANLFLNDELQIKIGGFRLAAKIEITGEKKKIMCGTPYYSAPEILSNKGHSFEVDVWSIGCIMYTLLIGKAPFIKTCLEQTYKKIEKYHYQFIFVNIFNRHLSDHAKQMITIMLQFDPLSRPKVAQLAQHDFLSGFTPSSLFVNCLTTAPRFYPIQKPLMQINNGEGITDDLVTAHEKPGDIYIYITPIPRFNVMDNFTTILNMLKSAIESKPTRENKVFGDEMTDPEAQPLVWVSKWVDYSNNNGFSYKLCDDSVGIKFNDTTKLILLPNKINAHSIDITGLESDMTVSNYPKKLEKKMKFLAYSERYLREDLKEYDESDAGKRDALNRIPHLLHWARSTTSVLMLLNNGTIQMNLNDHTKIIICPLMASISYIDVDQSFRTFRFTSIEQNGCSRKLYEKIRCAYDKIVLFQQQSSDCKYIN